MFASVVTGLVLAAASLQRADTVIPVPAGARLDFQSHNGDLTIRTWNRREMRIVVDRDYGERLEVATAGSVMQVRLRSRRGTPHSADWAITIPADMDIEVGGTNLDVRARGIMGSATIQTVQGDIELSGGRRLVSVHSVSGDVDVTDAEGRLELGTTNGDVTVIGARGELRIETVNGDVTMRRITSDYVEGGTVNGDVDYDGTIRRNGRYVFTTHSGDITATVASTAAATVTVSTFSGEFQADFPVTLTETQSGGKRFTFVMGDGSAQVKLESFSGEIRLVSPGAVPRRRREQ